MAHPRLPRRQLLPLKRLLTGRQLVSTSQRFPTPHTSSPTPPERCYNHLYLSRRADDAEPTRITGSEQGCSNRATAPTLPAASRGLQSHPRLWTHFCGVQTSSDNGEDGEQPPALHCTALHCGGGGLSAARPRGCRGSQRSREGIAELGYLQGCRGTWLEMARSRCRHLRPTSLTTSACHP